MENDLTTFHWDVGTLPFIWGHLSEPTNGKGIPDTRSQKNLNRCFLQQRLLERGVICFLETIEDRI